MFEHIQRLGYFDRTAERFGAFDPLGDQRLLRPAPAMALGGCRALVEMGVEPGKDVAVVVIVDTALCRYYSPPLTAFRPALEPLGRRMGEMLLAFMPAFAGPEGTKIIREIWPLELVVRDSD